MTSASSFDEVEGKQKKLLSSGLAKQIKKLWTDGTWGSVDGRGQDLSCLREKQHTYMLAEVI